jgi:hypothetical protein
MERGYIEADRAVFVPVHEIREVDVRSYYFEETWRTAPAEVSVVWATGQCPKRLHW